MVQGRRSARFVGVVAWALGAVLAAAPGPAPARADTVVLKNGTTLKGLVDRDLTTVSVSDGLKRTVFRDNRMERIDPDPGYSLLEKFALVQPLEIHVGQMPAMAVDIRSTPWDSKGRRSFRYTTQKPKGPATVEMQQAINEMTPHMVRYRGIDGFWLGQVETNQVPRPVITGLLARVDQTDQEQRNKIARWLIQAEWYPEARQALDGLARDFPDMKQAVEDVRRSVGEMEARAAITESALRRNSRQPNDALARLRAIPDRDLPEPLVEEIHTLIRAAEDRRAADLALAFTLRRLADDLPDDDRKAWKDRLAEVLEGLADAPDAARTRLEPPPAATPPADPASTRDQAAPVSPAPEEPNAQARFARLMSSWVVGPDAATDDLKLCSAWWRGRDAAQAYLVASDTSARETALAELGKTPEVDVLTLEKILGRMRPPLRDRDRARETSQPVTIRRVADDANPVPSEYAVALPPEYHPLRSYPTVVVLHDGRGPAAGVATVAAEAARRGFIVVAPEYVAPGKPGGDPAAVILALRDARKRYAIDSDRVFIMGQLDGGQVAWEIGLGHPDTFAGVASLSGFPARYSYRYGKNAEFVALYIALGELAPGAREVVYDGLIKKMIDDVQDVTYVDYLKRGYEPLPEEVPSAFEWMTKRKRDPYPKKPETVSARFQDDRFFGVVIRDFAPGRIVPVEQADPFGKNLRLVNLKMVTSGQGNSASLSANGAARMDIWLPTKLIDPNRTIFVKVNGNLIYRGQPAPTELAPMLEDVRVRGDRQQIYFLKVAYDGPRTRIRE